MTSKKRKGRFFQVLFAVLLTALISSAIYVGSLPERYNLEPGTIADIDITAPRAIIDQGETDLRAKSLANEVAPIYSRSNEISDENITRLTLFFRAVYDVRSSLRDEDGSLTDTYWAFSDRLKDNVEKDFGISLTDNEAFKLITANDSVIQYINSQTLSTAALVQADMVDDQLLDEKILEMTEHISEGDTMYLSNAQIVQSLLSKLLVPNAIYDEELTQQARQRVYDQAMSHPIMIERGARIISVGDTIDQDTYDILISLDLVEGLGRDISHLLSTYVYVILILVIISFYFARFEHDSLGRPRDLVALTITYLIPILLSLYLCELSPLLAPVYFTAVIFATYLDARSAMILSLLQVLIILPLCNFDMTLVLVGIGGVFVASIFAGKKNRNYNYATLIFLVAIICALIAALVGIIVKKSTAELGMDVLFATISGAVSVVAAIGFMPIFEIISNTVSPIRLVNISQPGNPILKRLFVEAPGTSQHSMMVANLSDSAAEAIGANALLAKVAAYYHDIGKLEKPEFFSENQQNMANPHDQLLPKESAAIILSHPEYGVRLARKYRLPSSVIRIIQEHHGSTLQAYFYHKAKQLAQKGKADEPNIDDYRYPFSIPTSKESAIVMLADTCEAAIKSTGAHSLEEAEELFRRLIRQKIEQDQLIQSKLSFDDLEAIIRAFLQVYAGVFHERVKYPDASSIR